MTTNTTLNLEKIDIRERLLQLLVHRCVASQQECLSYLEKNVCHKLPLIHVVNTGLIHDPRNGKPLWTNVDQHISLMDVGLAVEYLSVLLRRELLPEATAGIRPHLRLNLTDLHKCVNLLVTLDRCVADYLHHDLRYSAICSLCSALLPLPRKAHFYALKVVSQIEAIGGRDKLQQALYDFVYGADGKRAHGELFASMLLLQPEVIRKLSDGGESDLSQVHITVPIEVDSLADIDFEALDLSTIASGAGAGAEAAKTPVVSLADLVAAYAHELDELMTLVQLTHMMRPSDAGEPQFPRTLLERVKLLLPPTASEVQDHKAIPIALPLVTESLVHGAMSFILQKRYLDVALLPFRFVRRDMMVTHQGQQVHTHMCSLLPLSSDGPAMARLFYQVAELYQQLLQQIEQQDNAPCPQQSLNCELKNSFSDLRLAADRGQLPRTLPWSELQVFVQNVIVSTNPKVVAGTDYELEITAIDDAAYKAFDARQQERYDYVEFYHEAVEQKRCRESMPRWPHYRLCFYHPDLVPLDSKVQDQIKALLLAQLESVLGYAFSCDCIFKVTIAPSEEFFVKEQRQAASSLLRIGSKKDINCVQAALTPNLCDQEAFYLKHAELLVDLFKALDLLDGHDLKTYLQRQVHYTVTCTNQNTEYVYPRSDVIAGVSSFYDLVREFYVYSSRPLVLDQDQPPERILIEELNVAGVTAGFLTFAFVNGNGSVADTADTSDAATAATATAAAAAVADSTEAVSAAGQAAAIAAQVVAKLQGYIAQNTDTRLSSNCYVEGIGSAYSSTKVFVDLIIWDVNAFMQAAAMLKAEMKLNKLYFYSFYPYTKPVEI